MVCKTAVFVKVVRRVMRFLIKIAVRILAYVGSTGDNRSYDVASKFTRQ